jgi:glycosyltransferase involved in cell wall biosynthesis
VLTVGEESLREERDGYTVIQRPALFEPLGNAISPGVAQLLRRTGSFDVVHAHSHLYFSTNLAALARWVGETPLAITNHGLYSQTAPEWVFDLYLKSLGRWTFNRADVVFCYTDEDCNRVRGLGVNSRIEVVPNGVDTERFTPEGPTSERINHDGLVVLFVGRLVEGKRPQDAVQAVSRLANEVDVKLYIVGDGPMRSELETVASEAVELLGQVPYEEMPDMYRSGDVLVLPSRAEGLPRTVLEAMASGIPVVTSDLKQVAPVVSGAGVTVPVGDVEGFAVGIEQMLDGQYENPRRRIDESFDWQETVERTTAVLEEL